MIKVLVFAAVVGAFTWNAVAPAVDAINARAAAVEAAAQ